MCTASWLSDAGTLRLLFNRDELRSREPALPPRVFAGECGRWIAPRDGRAGGTWIAAGERGVVLALLNRFDGLRPAAAASRGLLIPQLLAADGPDALLAELASRRLGDFMPFRLLGLWRDLPRGIVAGWDGRALESRGIDAASGLLCSSSLGDERVTAARGAVWERRRAESPQWSRESHRDFHRDHTPEPSAWSVCMHRDDAQSVSLTAVELARDEIRLVYHDAPPCQPGAAHPLRLPAAGPAPGT